MVNDYGIKIKRRTYDSPELTSSRRQHSGISAKKGLWEVHHDPYDVSRIWVRNHHADGKWIQATWKHLHRTPIPFGELAWDRPPRPARGHRSRDRRRGFRSRDQGPCRTWSALQAEAHRPGPASRGNPAMTHPPRPDPLDLP
ncbi:Mu transposase C-terminal domain-containing protein [Streptomyces vinaceus]|uniref:Mu transposase C-terminal domain-containing protein n=1 Tax=Streptomyces vinaceus TaxID=1960 RepID=UPI0037F3FC0F